MQKINSSKNTDDHSSKSKRAKSIYKVRNWKQYDEALRNRGSLIIWISEEAIKSWAPKSTGKKSRGGQRLYSDLAIETCLTLGAVYHLPKRQTEGFTNSLLSNCMKLALKAPDHTTLSVRSKDINVPRMRRKTSEPIHMLIDSTGLKISGAGEWEEIKHGLSRRKVWRKLHLATDEETGEILAEELTDHHTDDPSQVELLIDQFDGKVIDLKADGAYDEKPVYTVLNKRGIKGIFPPRKDAILSNQYHINLSQRDINLIYIEKKNIHAWRNKTGYNKRNLVENTMFRYKKIIGNTLCSKSFKNQQTEVRIAVNILNKMNALGMPISERIRRGA